MGLKKTFPNGAVKAVTLSYDDDTVQNIRFLNKINEYGFKCTFNLNGGMLFPKGIKIPGWNPNMSKKDAAGVFSGQQHEIATHGYLHPDYTKLPVWMMKLDMRLDQKILNNVFEGGKLRGHAYPFGKFNHKVKKCLIGQGIRYARTVHSTFDFGLPEDWMEWNPTCHHKAPELELCMEQFLESKSEGLSLFYLWGHAYEFDEDDNWELLDRIGSILGNRKDIWYCTNGEMYDFTTYQEGRGVI